MIYGENKWKAIISSYSRENVTRAASMATENQTVWETEKKNNRNNNKTTGNPRFNRECNNYVKRDHTDVDC